MIVYLFYFSGPLSHLVTNTVGYAELITITFTILKIMIMTVGSILLLLDVFHS